MKSESGPLPRTSTQGPSLHSAITWTDSPPAAVVGLLHGYADHSARYAHVAGLWAERGIATVAIDLRGHGRSGGTRGHCEHFDEFLDDVAELSHAVTERAAGAPAILFGHSFGGLVAASSALARPGPWKGLLLSGPFFGVALAVPRIKVLAGRLASRLVPAFAQPSGIPSSHLTHDAAIARAYDDDPLVFKTATARWFTETTAAQESAIARAPALALPLHVVIGAADPIVSVPRARVFFDAAGSADKTWDARPGLYHEVLNEPSWREIARGLADWILAHARG